MFDPGAYTNIGITGGLLTALWLVLKYKPWRNNDSHVLHLPHSSQPPPGALVRSREASAGELDPAVWDARIQAIMQREIEGLMADIRALMESRNIIQREKLLDPILAEIVKTRHDLRNVVSEAIAKAYLESRGKKFP